MGFVTGHNAYSVEHGETGAGRSPNAIFAWVDNYCATSPLDNLMTAASRLVEALKLGD